MVGGRNERPTPTLLFVSVDFSHFVDWLQLQAIGFRTFYSPLVTQKQIPDADKAQLLQDMKGLPPGADEVVAWAGWQTGEAQG
jgi:hypothetical protein